MSLRDAHRSVMRIAKDIEPISMIPFEIEREFWFQKHAARLGVGNADYIHNIAWMGNCGFGVEWNTCSRASRVEQLKS